MTAAFLIQLDVALETIKSGPTGAGKEKITVSANTQCSYAVITHRGLNVCGRRVRGSNPTPDHFGGRRQRTVTQLSATPDLVIPYVIQCHSKFEGHGCWFPARPSMWALMAIGHVSFTAIMLQGCQVDLIRRKVRIQSPLLKVRCHILQCLLPAGFFRPHGNVTSTLPKVVVQFLIPRCYTIH